MKNVRRLVRELHNRWPANASRKDAFIHVRDTFLSYEPVLERFHLDRNHWVAYLKTEDVNFVVENAPRNRTLKRLREFLGEEISDYGGGLSTIGLVVKSLAFYITDQECPVCEEGDFLATLDIDTDRIILSCPECNSSFFRDGESADYDMGVPMSESRLEREGLMTP